jgi:hypothetical protein
MKDKQSEFLRTVLNNPENKQEALVFATIKLPEILKGMEEKDFKLIRKQKQVNFKKGLDLTIKQQSEVLFMGMNEREILMNQAEFRELGLL